MDARAPQAGSKRPGKPGAAHPDPLLTGEENLILMADLHHLGRSEGRRRAAALLNRFDQVDAARKTPATYSGGMRRRLDLAMTLVGDPKIIFLDEPTTDLDPRSRRTMWQIIRELVAGGATIFLTTQYLEEADQLADRIAVLDRGKLVAEGTADELKRRLMMTHSGVLTPVVMLLLFVEVFGNTLGAGLGGSNRGSYINYVTPAILIMIVGSGCATTAVNLCMDMTEGIIARFRTMAISPASVLTGQVLGSLIRTMISVTLVIGVALLMGFRPTAGPAAWIAAIGLIALLTRALTWLAVVFGLVTKTPAGANSLSLIPQFLLPFTSSAFVRPDSMPAGVRWFAENQPFTLVIDTLRGLLLGDPRGNSAVIAVAWCAGITLVGYLWARAAFNRDSAR